MHVVEQAVLGDQQGVRLERTGFTGREKERKKRPPDALVENWLD